MWKIPGSKFIFAGYMVIFSTLRGGGGQLPLFHAFPQLVSHFKALKSNFYLFSQIKWTLSGDIIELYYEIGSN